MKSKVLSDKFYDQLRFNKSLEMHKKSQVNNLVQIY